MTDDNDDVMFEEEIPGYDHTRHEENMPSREDILQALQDELMDEQEDPRLNNYDLYTVLEFWRYMRYLGGSYELRN